MLMVIYPMFPQAEGWLTLLGLTVLPMDTMIMDGGTLFILCGLLMYLCRLKSTKLEALAFAYLPARKPSRYNLSILLSDHSIK